MSKSAYSKEIKLLHTRKFSFYLYHMRPGGIEKSHYHDGIEIEYVIKGHCKTHHAGHLYFRKRGTIHEGINDSKNELIFFNLTIPAETDQNTHYI